MSENLAVRAKKKTASTYLALAAIFVAFFGGITVIAYFISKLNFKLWHTLVWGSQKSSH